MSNRKNQEHKKHKMHENRFATSFLMPLGFRSRSSWTKAHLPLIVGFLMMAASAAAGQIAAPAGQVNIPGSPFNSPFNTTATPPSTPAGQVNTPASPVKTTRPGESVERNLADGQKIREWSLDPNVADDIKRIKVCRVETVCKMRFKEGETPRMRVRNLVVPLRYEDENIAISEAFTRQVQEALDNLHDKRGVTVRFIGYTDNAPLDRSRRADFRKPALVVEGQGAARRAGDAGEARIAGLGDRKRWSRRHTSGGLQRHRAGTSVESPHRGGILV